MTGLFAVRVAYAGPEGEAIVTVELPAHATVADAIERSGLVERFGLDAVHLTAAIWGQRVPPGTPVAAGDRVELLRPLVADPKDARRRHAAERPLARRRSRAKRRQTSL